MAYDIFTTESKWLTIEASVVNHICVGGIEGTAKAGANYFLYLLLAVEWTASRHLNIDIGFVFTSDLRHTRRYDAGDAQAAAELEASLTAFSAATDRIDRITRDSKALAAHLRACATSAEVTTATGNAAFADNLDLAGKRQRAAAARTQISTKRQKISGAVREVTGVKNNAAAKANAACATLAATAAAATEIMTEEREYSAVHITVPTLYTGL